MDQNSKGDRLKNLTDKWEREICSLRKMEEKYPQESYSMVARSVQLDWIFLQHVMKNMGQALMRIETFMQEKILPRLCSDWDYIFLCNKKRINTTIYYVQAASWLVQSRASNIFQLLISSRRLKGRGGTVKKIRMPWMMLNARESSANKVPPKNIFPKHQTYGWLDKSMMYHSYWYSTCRNGIFRFLCAHYNINPPKLKKMIWLHEDLFGASSAHTP